MFSEEDSSLSMFNWEDVISNALERNTCSNSWREIHKVFSPSSFCQRANSPPPRYFRGQRTKHVKEECENKKEKKKKEGNARVDNISQASAWNIYDLFDDPRFLPRIRVLILIARDRKIRRNNIEMIKGKQSSRAGANCTLKREDERREDKDETMPDDRASNGFFFGVTRRD